MIGQLLMSANGTTKAVSTVDLLDPFGDGSGVALYKFDGDATEESGNYNGTATSVTYGTGKFGQCAVFNGGSSKVQLAQEIFTSTTQVSVSLWFKTTNNAVDGFDEFMFSKRNGILTFDMCVNTTGQLNLGNWDSHVMNSTSIVTNGVWRNAVFTFGAQTGKLYIDGVLESTYNGMTLSTQSFPTANAIGCFDGYARYFTGSIDQVRIFNRALTATEVIALYNENVDTYVHYIPPQGFFNDGTEVAHYTFDGDVLDSVNNYDGTASNLTYGTGKLGQCGVFNGSSSYVNIYLQWQRLSTFSLSIWVKPTVTPTGYQMILNNRNIATDYNGALFYTENDGKISFLGTVTNGSWTDAVLYKFGAPPVGGAWTHYVVVKNGVTLTAYTNGVLTKSGSCSTAGYTLTDCSVIGSNMSAVGGHYDGSIDQFRIFNRALTATEVTALYNEGQ